MLSSYRSIIFISLLCLLIGFLLIAKTFQLKLAGGSGYQASHKFVVEDIQGEVYIDIAGRTHILNKGEIIERGSILKTQPASQIFLRSSSGIGIALHERTWLEFQKLWPTEYHLSLTKGRMIVFHHSLQEFPVTITTSKIKQNITKGTVSIVHYDFLSKIRIIPFDTSVEVLLDKKQKQQIQTPIDITENDLLITPANFDGNDLLLKYFYDWAFTRNDLQ